ncbi:class I SAM-dependent methyltransferase [Gemelliphila palaticanis]|uniref:Class I SAM-dependent methyltransferase n=1 Tax=Gemelliphila palaticanis TaxID=81950 RepID=A0ABX2SZA9_9BACL|nr:class I SAM-dependent methyltransferase [Gemella palaticanis]MBF0715775.1 class I SAM-dependent methyltransferase [Gemella palaticanis]NYS47705.1 class I SAM-dependent methyltransferase [Gemella palaticanis]
MFFHLDTAKVRIKSNNDYLINLIEDKNQEILDLTMGLARDSMVMSYFGHKVTAIESNSIIYNIVKYGLTNYKTGDINIDNAMKKITTINSYNYEFLKNIPDNSYDVIYVDPMFEYKIKDSNNLNSIESLANNSKVTHELFEEMKRVARNKIIIKAHNKDEVFNNFNFKKYERSGSKFSYGYYNIGENNV